MSFTVPFGKGKIYKLLVAIYNLEP